MTVAMAILSFAVISIAVPASSAGQGNCDPSVRGVVVDDCAVVNADIAKISKQDNAATGAGLPFKISVDGVATDGTQTDADRKTDLGLEAVDIQVKFDGLDAKQILSVKAERPKGDATTIHFRAHTNYAGFLKRGEIRIYKTADDISSGGVNSEPIETLELDADGVAAWEPGLRKPGEYTYVLRVYNDAGIYDETARQSMSGKTDRLNVDDFVTGSVSEDPTEDLAKVRNIPVQGGAVTVYGTNVPAGHEVRVLGWKVPTDTENKFLFQQILPPGDHDVEIAVNGGNSEGLQFTRQVNIPKNDWFYVALADLTVGRRFGDNIETAAPGEFDKTYTKGRLAFYLKGKIKGKYLLTAAADTGEGSAKDMFKSGSNKGPRELLRRLDPDDYYPIYGDDSTIVEDAPTSGKVYIRLERGQSHVMWGNFKTTINGATFARNERALYGAHALYKSEKANRLGMPKTQIEAFAAEPGTIPQRDDFLGTGGSAYFLKRQDVTTGSEQVVIERRNPVTGEVVSRTVLAEGKDYTIDYFQGVIILKAPLNSTTAGGGAIIGGPSGSDELHLVVNYEATPALGRELGQSYGGRAEQWLGDKVRVGATGLSEKVGGERNEKLEADLLVRMSEKSEIEFEVAQSRGRGVGQAFSTDGGLTFRDELVVGSINETALAYRMRGKADLGEMTGGALSGGLDGYYEFREAGFSALDGETKDDTQAFGAGLYVDLSDKVRARIAAEGKLAGKSSRRLKASAEFEAQVAENWSLIAGVTWSSEREPAKAHANGDTVDVGARVIRKLDEKSKVYAFAQATVARKGDRLKNNRIGAGVETQLTERLKIGAEASYGTTGVGGALSLTYNKDADTSYFAGYKLDPDRGTYSDTSSSLVGSDYGILTAGAKVRLDDWTTAFTESNADIFGKSRKLSQVYGLTFTPDKVWSVSLGMALGTVFDPYASDFDRKAFTAQVDYSTEITKLSLNGEVRFEDSDDDTRDRTTWLAQADASVKTNDNWRLIGHLDALFSQSDQSDLLNGTYVEASIGAAYRPIENDRLNLLFKYTYLHDLPGAQQVNADGNIFGPAQKSHILSVDASYDINEWLTIGAKYGFRSGEVSDSRARADFTASTAHLGILRADIAVVKNWDLLFEGRVLHSVEAKQTEYGFLAAAYRHVGDNMKVGVGYNFGKFSDDLSDLTLDDGGVFLNVVGKF
ncbi:MAG: TonB-dependent receptor [Rhizobiaceae bacterium]